MSPTSYQTAPPRGVTAVYRRRAPSVSPWILRFGRASWVRRTPDLGSRPIDTLITRRRARAACGGPGPGVLVAACGGGGDDSSSTAGTRSTTSTGASPSTTAAATAGASALRDRFPDATSCSLSPEETEG